MIYRDYGSDGSTAARCLSLIARHAPRLMREGGGAVHAEQLRPSQRRMGRALATAKRREIMALHRQGKPRHVIAAEVGVSRSTVTRTLGSSRMVERLIQMLNELESHKLEVMLAPSRRSDRREWDMIRVVCDAPPRWYRNLCNRHPSSRGVRRGKFDTRIRRRDVLRLLERMASGRPVVSKYAPELAQLARRAA
jgi:hypothetical protein